MEDPEYNMIGADKKKKIGEGQALIIPASSQETVKLSNKQK